MSQGNENRRKLLGRGVRLEYFTIGYNLLEALVAAAAGFAAGSIALVGFGLDSLIEVTAAVALLWRFRRELGLGGSGRGTDSAGEETALDEGDGGGHKDFERKALFVVALTFFALAGYIVLQSGYNLIYAREVRESTLGIGVAIVSLVVMPVLALSKQRVARALQSKSLAAEARETWLCAYLSVVLLVGLSLNALFGWQQADSIAALAMLPLVIKEGFEALEEAGEAD
ncbi:MAG: cation transporter [Thermoleophilia bacterium]